MKQLTFLDALAIARGCTDYSGGYRGTQEYEAYQHGIATVIAALQAAAEKWPHDTQVKTLHAMGSNV